MGTGHATYLSQHVPGANVVAICEPHAEASSALVDDLSPDERPLVQFVSALGASTPQRPSAPSVRSTLKRNELWRRYM